MKRVLLLKLYLTNGVSSSSRRLDDGSYCGGSDSLSASFAVALAIGSYCGNSYCCSSKSLAAYFAFGFPMTLL